MLKFSRLTKFLPATFILLTAKAACSQSVSASSKYPVVLNSNSVPICYTQKPDDTNLNLSNLCRKVTEPKVTEPTTLTNQSEDDQSEDEAEPTTLAEQKQYEADLNDLISRRQKMPDTNTLINDLCTLHGLCNLDPSNLTINDQ